MKKDLILLGAGGHARSVLDTATQAGYSVIGIIDLNYSGRDEDIMGVKVIGGLEQLDRYTPAKAALFLAHGDNGERAELFARFGGYTFPNLIHPSAIVAPGAEVGAGTIVHAGAILNAMVSVGENTIINTAAVIDHESSIGPHCHIGPRVVVSGRVRIGEGTFVGVGSTIKDKIKVGAHVVIGAGAVVIRDIPDGSKVAGVPAKPIS
jgi:UDP-perosamine 4-acetyltransferase